MVARPSVKRVVPGSVPPWRALCAEPARFLGQAFVPARGPRARRGPAAASVAWRSRVRGRPRRFLLRARVFRGPVVVSGCRNVFRGRAVVFHFRRSRRRGSLSSSLRLIRSLSTFAVEPLLALRGAELPSWRGVAAKRELEIIAKPLALLHEALLSGRSFLRTETRSYSLSALATYCLPPACQFVLFAARRFLQFVTYFVGRAAC